GNATRKAVVAAAFTGEIAVADDTSLCVRALNDLPDVFAARFAGPGATYADNCRLLSELMRAVPDGFRHAVFRRRPCGWTPGRAPRTPRARRPPRT
ncbi:MAG: hypothetical protein IPH09_13265, partial [bacterium]|nr:hypothetical protein [bacterium]